MSTTNIKVICPYCVRPAELVDSIEIYKRRSYGMAYLCRPCGAYVGTHKGTHKPLGRLANRELRQAKIKAHAAFDPLWKDGDMSRKQAYKWLAVELGINGKDCHIGMFDIAMCERVTSEAEQR